MNDNELNAFAEIIWGDTCSIGSENKTKEEIMNLIKSSLIKIEYEARKLGRKQILNHFENEILNLNK